MSLTTLQRDFARNWALNPVNPVAAAVELRLDDGVKVKFTDAVKMAESWTRDPAVIAERKRFIKAGIVKDVLPTRDEFLLVMWDRLRQQMGNDDFVKLGKLFAEVSMYTNNTQPVTNFGASPEQLNERIDQLLKRRIDRVM